MTGSMTARKWIGFSIVFLVMALAYAAAMAIMVFGLQTVEPTVLLVSWTLKALASELMSFGCSMIGILGRLLGGVEGLVEVES